jgi:eukaryotic-like serine/threonine-protein kinase
MRRLWTFGTLNSKSAPACYVSAMPIGTPSVIGPYRIERELGRGGMGIVYLAHDTRLNRRVAIKALPDDVAADPERLSRFEREARMLASLNHPNLAAVYDVLEVDGRRYLAMEYVEGEALSERIARDRALPLAEALELCAQIAAGMEAAHEGGVIHRDLKPANVMITPGERAKVVDFGLAKGRERDDEPTRGHAVSPVLASSPTLEAPGTMPGVILGTAEYLSPEQARGKSVDRRTDIWSFGCILYECLTGKRLFAGETVSDSIAAILARPLDWSALPKESPPRVRELLERCLERDPRKRLRDIGEARLALESSLSAIASSGAGARTAAGATRARPPALWRRLMPALGVLGALVLAWHLFGGSIRRWIAGPPPRLAHLSLNVPSEWGISSQAISPDGSFIVITARATTQQGERPTEDRLYIRRVDQGRFDPVKGSEGVRGFSISPDSKSIYFGATQTGGEPRLMRVPADGSAPPLTIGTYRTGWAGGAILRSGDVVIGQEGNQFVRLHPGSPPPAPKSLGLTEVAFPARALPGDRHVLFETRYYDRGAFRSGAAVLNLASGKAKVVLREGANPRVLPSGYMLFTRRGTLLGMRFDLRRMETQGEPVALLDGLYREAEWSDARFDVSDDGTLLYRPSATEAGIRRFVSIGPAGKVEEWSSMKATFEEWFHVDPVGSRVVCFMANAEAIYEIYVLERGQSRARRLSSDPDADCAYPFWSRDGKTVGFSRMARTAADGVYVVDAAGSEPRRLGKIQDWSPGLNAGWGSWSPGDSLIFLSLGGLGPIDLGFIRVDPGGRDTPVRLFARTAPVEIMPDVSPDGRFLAYISDESGRQEAFVAPLQPGPTLGQGTQISTEGVVQVRWSRDGSRLYYESGDRRVFSISVRTKPSLDFGKPSLAWDLAPLRILPRGWDLLPDGRLLALERSKDEEAARQYEVVLHFDQEVKRKLAAK